MFTRTDILMTTGLLSVQVIVALCLVSVAAMASARPRFLAIPLEDVEFLRGPEGPVPVFRQRRQVSDEPEAAADNSRSVGYGPNYVDYGAYTGPYGAFGWDSDHPVGYHGGKY